MRWALCLLAACGFELRPSTGGSDAPIDASIDAPPDARVFDPAADCPGSYPITLAGQTSRYRIILGGQPWWVHGADCNDDRAGFTHLAAVDNASELMAIMTRLNATTGLTGGQGNAYVGGVQLRNQTTDSAGWLAITGGPLLAMWDAGEPNDGGDNIENSAENFTMLERTRTSLIDVPGTASFSAMCECDGNPVDAAAAAAIIASMPAPPALR